MVFLKFQVDRLSCLSLVWLDHPLACVACGFVTAFFAHASHPADVVELDHDCAKL